MVRLTFLSEVDWPPPTKPVVYSPVPIMPTEIFASSLIVADSWRKVKMREGKGVRVRKGKPGRTLEGGPRCRPGRGSRKQMHLHLILASLAALPL